MSIHGSRAEEAFYEHEGLPEAAVQDLVLNAGLVSVR